MAWQNLARASLALALLGSAAVLADEPTTTDEDAAAPAETYDAGVPWSRTTDPEGYAPAPYPFPSLAYNYYYPAPGAGMMPARLYQCPRPVPLWMGYTYITYQGLAPHEFLYQHKQAYYRYNPGSGMTMTWITWR